MKYKTALPKYMYHVYQGMIQRCYNPASHSYCHYGARGITVCDKWLESIRNFANDLGERPNGFTLDRIDVNGNYEPANCRWASKLIQARNRRNTVMTEDKVRELLTDWHLRPRWETNFENKYNITLNQVKLIAEGKSFLLPDYYKIISGRLLIGSDRQFWYYETVFDGAFHNKVIWNKTHSLVYGKPDFITGNITHLRGNISGLCGNVSGLNMDVSNLCGDATLLINQSGSGSYYRYRGNLGIIPRAARLNKKNSADYWSKLRL